MMRAMPPMPAEVAAVFDAYPAPARAKLTAVRRLIFTTAEAAHVGAIEETLKWGEPAYLTSSKAGSTIRLGWKRAAPDHCAIYFNCKTTLVDTFRTLFATEFVYAGNRALILQIADPLQEKPLAACVAMALTYHRDKRRGAHRSDGSHPRASEDPEQRALGSGCPLPRA